MPPDHRHELKFLIPITLLDMTTITVIDHGMSLSVLYIYIYIYTSTCIVSLYRNDPTPRKIDRWLVFQTLYIYISKYKLKNLLVQTKFYWSWAGGAVLVVRTVRWHDQRPSDFLWFWITIYNPRLTRACIAHLIIILINWQINGLIWTRAYFCTNFNENDNYM